MGASIESSDRPLLERMESKGAVTIQELCEAEGVTPTAVRQRLLRLQGQGLVSRETVRNGRGRPLHEYRLTPLGTRELGNNYAELAILLWREVQNEDPAVRDRIEAKIKSRLSEKYGTGLSGQSVSARMVGLGQSLRDRGFRAEVGPSAEGLTVLTEHHCPYPELASEDSRICQLEQQVFESIVGAPLELRRCIRSGETACEFHVARG